MTREQRLEKALRAVLLFHDPGPWDSRKRELWWNLTFLSGATVKGLCDVVRQALDHPGDTGSGDLSCQRRSYQRDIQGSEE